MNKAIVKVFENEQFGKLRGTMIDNEPWWVAKDVALALGYADAGKAVRTHVYEDDRIGGAKHPPNVLSGIKNARYRQLSIAWGVSVILFGLTNLACTVWFCQANFVKLRSSLIGLLMKSFLLFVSMARM